MRVRDRERDLYKQKSRRHLTAVVVRYPLVRAGDNTPHHMPDRSDANTLVLVQSHCRVAHQSTPEMKTHRPTHRHAQDKLTCRSLIALIDTGSRVTRILLA